MKQFISELGRNVNLFSRVLDSMEDMVFIMEKVEDDFRYVFVNKKAKVLLDLDQTIIGKTMEEVAAPEIIDELKSKYLNAYRTKEPVKFEQEIDSTEGLLTGSIFLSAFIDENIQTDYIIAVVRDITELRKEQEILERMAFQDHLTGLANRRSFDDELTDVITKSKLNPTGKKLAVMMLDGKEFKSINDTFGHDAGDAVIQEFAKRVNHSVRENDIVARLGGDELAILLPDLDSKEEAIAVAERIINSLEEPFHYKGNVIRFGAGIGIAFYPDHGSSKRQMLRFADEALYDAKEENGRSNYKIYDCGVPQQEKNLCVI